MIDLAYNFFSILFLFASLASSFLILYFLNTFWIFAAFSFLTLKNL